MYVKSFRLEKFLMQVSVSRLMTMRQENNYTNGTYPSTFTQALNLSTILRYLYFTLVFHLCNDLYVGKGFLGCVSHLVLLLSKWHH